MFNPMTPRRLLGGSTVAAAALLMILLPAAHGADDAGGGTDQGTAPYVPSRAEWLCLTLNVEQTVSAVFRSPGDVAVRVRGPALGGLPPGVYGLDRRNELPRQPGTGRSF